MAEPSLQPKIFDSPFQIFVSGLEKDPVDKVFVLKYEELKSIPKGFTLKARISDICSYHCWGGRDRKISGSHQPTNYPSKIIGELQTNERIATKGSRLCFWTWHPTVSSSLHKCTHTTSAPKKTKKKMIIIIFKFQLGTSCDFHWNCLKAQLLPPIILQISPSFLKCWSRVLQMQFL